MWAPVTMCPSTVSTRSCLSIISLSLSLTHLKPCRFFFLSFSPTPFCLLTSHYQLKPPLSDFIFVTQTTDVRTRRARFSSRIIGFKYNYFLNSNYYKILFLFNYLLYIIYFYVNHTYKFF